MQLKLHMVTIEDLVPQEHFLRKLEAALDLSFIYHETEKLYSRRYGRRQQRQLQHHQRGGGRPRRLRVPVHGGHGAMACDFGDCAPLGAEEWRRALSQVEEAPRIPDDRAPRMPSCKY